MCYSILVETNLKKLETDFKATIDLENLLDIYLLRESGQKNIKIPRAFNSYFEKLDSPIKERCKELITEFENREIKKLKEKEKIQSQKIAELNSKLEKKWTKTNQTLLDRAMRVISKNQFDQKRMNGDIRDTDSIVHQYTYSPIIIFKNGQKKIEFKRYQLRSSFSKVEPPSKINMFNAREDSLEDRFSWRNLFLKSHGAIVLKGFYEWVVHPETHKKTIIHFSPTKNSLMWSPCLYDFWQSPDKNERIYSFAIITRDPAAEVEAMGHDRCPVYSKWQNLDSWIDPTNLSSEKAYQILHDLEEDRYKYHFGVTDKPKEVSND